MVPLGILDLFVARIPHRKMNAIDRPDLSFPYLSYGGISKFLFQLLQLTNIIDGEIIVEVLIHSIHHVPHALIYVVLGHVIDETEIKHHATSEKAQSDGYLQLPMTE